MWNRRKHKKNDVIRRKYKKGDVIIEEGSKNIDEAYILCSGKVEVSHSFHGDKIILNALEPRDVFGEMGLIEERPRSATVTAIEDVEVEVLNRDNFSEVVLSNRDMLIPFLRALFERIRTLNAMVVTDQHKAPDDTNFKVTMIGITAEARKALNGNSLLVETLPFRVGRQTSTFDVLAYNDLILPDKMPFQVSRNHFIIMKTAKGISIIDRGSTLGTIVNGHRIGGNTAEARMLLKEGENELIVGTEHSPYKFRVMLEQA